MQTEPSPRPHNQAPLQAPKQEASRGSLLSDYLRIRKDSEALCAPLETEDYGIQSMPDVSPPKWHLAHVSWFFETFLLHPFLTGYKDFHPQFAVLFNSYYNSVGRFHPRPQRGFLSRPTVRQVYAYRAYVDEHMQTLITRCDEQNWQEVKGRTILGNNHEQQHQELLLTDIKHNFATNPLRPQYRELTIPPSHSSELHWKTYEGGLTTIGHALNHSNDDFAFDNEYPNHSIYLNGFRLASRLITNGEFLNFIDDGGYQQANLWLSEAWKIVVQQEWQQPFYWQQRDGEWWQMTLGGMRTLDPHAPACHISFYEADAYARWVGKRLPTEAEWEVAAREQVIEGNLRGQGYLQPISVTNHANAQSQPTDMQQMYGDVWEWTQSPYTPYPGYTQGAGAFGEYNGKFMSNQMVLRGGSCVTPKDHIRATYRNFFYPADRWQFSGFRLAEDLS